MPSTRPSAGSVADVQQRPTIIQIQDALVARYRTAAERDGSGAGLLANRMRRGARKEADRALTKLGYAPADRYLILRDAVNVALHEVRCDRAEAA